MGGRYGPVSGVLAGAAAGVILLLATSVLTGQDPRELADAGKFMLVCLPVSGLICGELRNSLFDEAARAGIRLEHASHRLHALDEQVFILAETKDDLDRELALLNADTANLDYEIRRVLQSPPERFCDALLGVFCRKARLYEAAIYLEGTPWRRAAYSGKPEIWPEQMNVESSAVARSALKHSCIAMLPEVWGNEPAAADDFLLASPIGEPGDTSILLLVKSMPFSAMNTRGMQTIEIICRWMSEFAGLDRRAKGLFDPRGIVPLTDFDRMLELANIVQKKFRLISSVIVFHPPAGGAAAAEEVFRSVSGAIRVGDTTCALDSSHLALLLPLTGRRGAEICLTRFQEFSDHSKAGHQPLEGEVFCTNDFPGIEAMWSAIRPDLGRP